MIRVFFFFNLVISKTWQSFPQNWAKFSTKLGQVFHKTGKNSRIKNFQNFHKFLVKNNKICPKKSLICR